MKKLSKYPGNHKKILKINKVMGLKGRYLNKSICLPQKRMKIRSSYV